MQKGVLPGGELCFGHGGTGLQARFPQDGAGPQPGAEPQEPTHPIIVPKPRSQGGNAQPTLQEFLAMTGAERMALRTRNPALFQQLSALVRAARH